MAMEHVPSTQVRGEKGFDFNEASKVNVDMVDDKSS